MTKAESKAMVVLAIIAAPFVFIAKVIEEVGWIVPLLLLLALIGWYLMYQDQKKRQRLNYLRERYKDEDTVQKIFNGYFWQGQSNFQLLDSLGEPVDVDRKVFKTKTKEIWKYNQLGANRFALRITLENDEVVGWDKKA